MELVEKGILDGPVAEKTVRESLQPLLDEGADRIVLGCTHYPFLKDVIQRIAGPSVEVIDPAPAIARQLLRVMTAEGLVREDGGPDLPDVRIVASGDDSLVRELFRTII